MAASVAPVIANTETVIPYPSRVVLAWTPQDYVRASAQADGGTLQPAADFCAAIMRDAVVAGVLEQRTLGMLALPSVIETYDGKEVKDVPGWPKAFPEAEQRRLLEWGIGLGFGWARKNLRFIDGEWQLYIETWDARWFIWQDWDQSWYVQCRTKDYLSVYRKIVPGQGWIFYAPFGAREPWKYGLWHRWAVPYLAKTFAIDDRAREGEVTPILVGETTGLTDPQQAAFLEDLENLARDTRIVLPEGCKVSIVDRHSSTKNTIHKESIDWANHELIITTAGQVTTTEGSEGFSSGRVQKSILSSTLRAQEETFSTTVGEQALTPWAQFSQGYNGPTLYQRWQIQDTEDLLAQGYAVAQFAASIEAVNRALSSDGVKINTSALLAKAGIPLAQLPPELGQTTQPLPLSPAHIALVVTANDARASLGLPALPESEGQIKLAELELLQAAAKVEAEAEALPEPEPVAVEPPSTEPTEEEQPTEGTTEAEIDA